MSISRKEFLKSFGSIMFVPPLLSSLSECYGYSRDFDGYRKFYINDQSDFDKYKNYEFTEGSLILFARGKSFNGQFSPKGNGSKSKPIVVTTYDQSTGKVYSDDVDHKPQINARGKFPSTFHLNNSEYWTISNLEITNDSERINNEDVNLRGIDIQAKDFGVVNGITVIHNYVHDVNKGFEGKQRGAIFTEVSGDKIKTKFHKLYIGNNRIENVGGIGISNDSSWGSPGQSDYYPWTEVLLRGNQIKYTGRNAIIIRNSINPIVEYNTIGYSSRHSIGNSIFNFDTIGCIMQYNEVYGNTGELDDADRGGFDADFNSKGTIIQYNYSHDNHWFCSIMRKENIDVTVRYNISQNDRLGAYFYGFPSVKELKDVKIYNNTHYFGAGKGTSVFVGAGRTRIPIETQFLNNLFYFTDKGEWGNLPDHTCKVESNMFYNFKNEAFEEILANPLFVNPGNGEFNINMHDENRLSGYQLRKSSPAVDSGLLVEDNGGRDFWGRQLYKKSANIGASELR